MASLRRFEGYICVDHRASPGLPEDIARAAGFDPEHCKEGGLFEGATLTCSHCKSAFVKNHFRTRERPYCGKCDHYICDFCDAARNDPLYTHLPFDKKEELILESAVTGNPLNLLLNLKD